MGTVTAFPGTASETAPPRLLHTVEDAAERLSVGRTVMYALLRRDEIPSVRIGGKRLVAEADLAAYVDRLRAEALPYAETAP